MIGFDTKEDREGDRYIVEDDIKNLKHRLKVEQDKQVKKLFRKDIKAYKWLLENYLCTEYMEWKLEIPAKKIAAGEGRPSEFENVKNKSLAYSRNHRAK